MYQIEILERYDSSSYFFFCPVKLKLKNRIADENVQEFKDVIGIEEGNVECFLSYFLYKHFDKKLPYNRNRYDESSDEYIKEFEWYVTRNFYTYDSMKKMLSDISQTAAMLAKDYDNPKLKDIKKDFSIFYMTSNGSDWLRDKDESTAIRENINAVIDFYNRFTKLMNKMMADNPEANLISVMGP